MENEDYSRSTEEKKITTISQDVDNYIRISLLLTLISPSVVRAFFDSEFHPARLEESMKKERAKLMDLKGKRVINKSQWNLLFPKKGTPDSKQFDVTLMITLLTHLAQFSRYDQLPNEVDITESADLARIKHYRNLISHKEDGKIDNSYFTDAWSCISGAIERLGGEGMLKECTDLKTKPLEPIVPCNIRVQIMWILEKWKENAANFVETTGSRLVLEGIRENNFVTITASSGAGKTATLQYVALQMADEGYDILLVTSPCDIVKFYDPKQKTLFVIDDFCGTHSINLSDLNNWITVLDRIKLIIQVKFTKILVACRLQVFREKKFESVSLFRTCVCNLQSDNLCLSKSEKMSIAELYLEEKASDIFEFCDLYDCFPLLCKLYCDNPSLNIIDFFKNPFSVYEAEIDKLNKNGHFSKYCALALCVMFNNRLVETLFTDEIDKRRRKIIKNTCEQCKLNRGTSRLLLLDEIKSLECTFLKREFGVYKTLHDKIFDILLYYFGQNMTGCLIKNAHSGVIMRGFLLDETESIDAAFVTVLSTKYHQMYMQRLVDDWSRDLVNIVFSNINMKITKFRENFLSFLKTLTTTLQKQLALACTLYNNNSALHCCCVLGDMPFIQWCLHYGAEVNQCNNYGESILYSAVLNWKCHIDVVSLLLDKKADINICALNGISPLYLACLNNHIKVVKMLLDNKATMNECTYDGSNSLHTACFNNHKEVVMLLLDYKAEINKRMENPGSPFCHSYYRRLIEVSRRKLEEMPDLEESTETGATPLYLACLNNNIEIVELLLDKKADVNKCTDKGTSPLTIACRFDHRHVVKLLLDQNADINKSTFDLGVSPLIEACVRKHIETVKLLLEYKVDIDQCANNEGSPLHAACDSNQEDLVRLLLHHNANIDKCEESGTTPLFAACAKNYIKIVKLLLEQKANINQCDKRGVSPLYIACQNNIKEEVSLLIKNKADVNKCINNGQSPLCIASNRNHIEIVKALLEHKAIVNRCRPDKRSILYDACANNHTEVVQLLLDNMADINKCSDEGVSPLFIACQKNHKEIVKILLTKKADVNISRGKVVSPLSAACYANHEEIVKLLLDKNADVNKCTIDGESPLYTVCQNNHINLVKLLLHSRAYINKSNNVGKSPLFIACQHNHLEVVKLLLEEKAHVNMSSDSKISPLSVACFLNHEEIVKCLLDKNADVNECTTFGDSPLYTACKKNHINLVKLLLDRKADINMCNDSGVTPVFIACLQNNIEVVRILLNKKADINISTKDLMSPLSIACFSNHEEIAMMLMDKNAVVNKCNTFGVSPLHSACRNNNINLVKILLNGNADINLCDDSRSTPLIIACKRKHIEIVKILLDSKAEIFEV